MTELLEYVQDHQPEVMLQIANILLAMVANANLLYVSQSSDNAFAVYGRVTTLKEIQLTITKGEAS